MKITLNFKTPDVAEYALEGLDEDAQDEVLAVINKFVRWGECVTIVLDTETQTATVKAV
jgi:hypothetical protein